MNKAVILAAALLTSLLSATLSAQSINLGRGELPVTVPANYDEASPAPLIMLLHGYTSSGMRNDAYMGVSDLADDYGFIFVAPDGTLESAGDNNRFWNASDACCNFYESSVDDVAYINSIIDALMADYAIDSERVYLIGHSNGGFMSYRMAYEHSDRFTAIASLAGASHMEERPAPASPIHVLQIHGTADGTISYTGGDIQGTRYPSAMQTVSRWASYNGCSTAGRGREQRDLDASLPGYESGTMVFRAGCNKGGSAELWTISAGAHVPVLSDTFAQQVVEWLLSKRK
ncbi:MAG: PHB depolymerase family esterase [Gammaproteobacteria bacterium]